MQILLLLFQISLLKTSNKTFDAITISKSRTTKTSNLFKTININYYCKESTPPELHAVGTLLYIYNKLYVSLEIFVFIKTCELYSSFIETINSKTKTNITIWCIYRHPAMNLSEFNDKTCHKKFQKKRRIYFFVVILM